MPSLIIENALGERVTVDAQAGESVMQAARRHLVPGIVADCGGELSCATCHVFVEPSWATRLPSASEAELEMLECTAVEPTACCQIRLDERHEGLVVILPSAQK
jgi:2Fe-2S ferredoxin